MSRQELTSAPSTPMPAARLIALIGLTLAIGYAVVLGGAWLGGHWLTDSQGQPIAGDFVNVWAAGRLTLDGNPAAAYDWTLHKAAESATASMATTVGIIRRPSCSPPQRWR
jgi:hypothetical protein